MTGEPASLLPRADYPTLETAAYLNQAGVELLRLTLVRDVEVDPLPIQRVDGS